MEKHIGKTTFAKKLESIIQPAVVIDQDNHAKFINKYYINLRPSKGPNTLKFNITNTIVEYAIQHSNLHLILSNSNLNKQGRANVLRHFHGKGFRSIIVYFELPMELLKERVQTTQRSKAIFRSARSFMEVLDRQAKLKAEKPTTGESDYLFVIRNPEELQDVYQQIEEISRRSII